MLRFNYIILKVRVACIFDSFDENELLKKNKRKRYTYKKNSIFRYRRNAFIKNEK